VLLHTIAPNGWLTADSAAVRQTRNPPSLQLADSDQNAADHASLAVNTPDRNSALPKVQPVKAIICNKLFYPECRDHTLIK